MVSRRKRANSSVGNKLNSLTDKVTGQEKLQQVSGTQTNAVTNDSIALGAVNTESVSDRSITSAKIGRGEVTSENLGVINEIIASDGLDIENGVDGHLSLSGGKYEAPYDGIEDGLNYKVVAFDPTNNAIKVIDAYPPAESGLRFDTTYTEGSTAVGMLSWSDEFETLEFMSDENVSIQIGQETVYRVKNASGSVAIPKFRLVMFAGATGDTVTVSPATATAIRDNPAYLVGITAEEIPADDFGFVTHFGFLSNVNTNSFTLGDLLYLDSATTTGVLTAIKPSAPFFDTPIAAVTRVQTNSGRVLVRMEFGSKMSDLHDAQITSASEGQTLLYNSSGVWVNSNPPSPNYLINGGFDFWQRGTSFSATGYTADRWYMVETGASNATQYTSATTTLPSVPTGIDYAVRLQTLGTDDKTEFYQPLESSIVVPLRGKTVTFSCYVKMEPTMAGNLKMGAWYSNVDDAYASQTTEVSSVTLVKADYADWLRASLTFTVPSDADGLKVGFDPLTLTPDTTDTFYWLAAAQLELGSVATPFRRNSPNPQAELAACQRYYYRANSDDTFSLMASGSYFNTTQAWLPFYTPVVLRVAPAFSWSGAFRLLGGGTARTITTLDLYTYQALNPVVLRATTASTTNGQTAALQTNDNATSYLEFDAEL